MTINVTADSLTQYQALTETFGVVSLEGWAMLELTGDDRRSFLHNFCTADVKGLADGKVTEAFVLDGKGKTLGHVHVAAMDGRLLLVGANGQGPTLFQHLDRYIIREKVTIVDRSAETACLLLAGPDADRQFQNTFEVELAVGETASLTLEDVALAAIHTEVAGPGFLICGPAQVQDSVCETLLAVGGLACSREVLESVRIEYGTPWFGVEISDANLPQEFERDEKAISFHKGCYLGQETVARIDALGRVNKLLRIARGSGVSGGLSTGSAVLQDEKEVGILLASASVPGTEETIVSVMVKRSSANVGQRLIVDGFEFEIVTPRA